MTDPLHQMNISYVATEDRLLLRASTRGGDEYRIWLTRRFCSLLSGIVQTQMEKFGGAPVLAASNEARQLFKQGAMEKKFAAENNTNFPLGPSGILAHRINSKINEDGTLALQLLPGSGEGITLNLNQTLLYMFYNLLAQGMEQAEWHLGQANPDAKVH
ncbi:MAG: hypothetical protein A3H91_00625 [Gammaproteobacteria bacterium RIFCSPLOWO2_02_FULL_61_13]|nr:MAG: hypothetical protein A3H91_00625 [Gammaproteobacteria bacterium RIFCSPLOWO2_02_FULL_61_13]